MLEKFQKYLEEYMNKQDENKIRSWDLEHVQKLFEMQDTNKDLMMNAINQRQLDSALRYEEHIQKLLKNLYVPDYQSKNV